MFEWRKKSAPAEQEPAADPLIEALINKLGLQREKVESAISYLVPTSVLPPEGTFSERQITVKRCTRWDRVRELLDTNEASGDEGLKNYRFASGNRVEVEIKDPDIKAAIFAAAKDPQNTAGQEVGALLIALGEGGGPQVATQTIARPLQNESATAAQAPVEKNPVSSGWSRAELLASFRKAKSSALARMGMGDEKIPADREIPEGLALKAARKNYAKAHKEILENRTYLRETRFTDTVLRELVRELGKTKKDERAIEGPETLEVYLHDIGISVDDKLLKWLYDHINARLEYEEAKQALADTIRAEHPTDKAKQSKELFTELIDNEEQRLRAAKAAEWPPKEAGAIRKSLSDIFNWYRKVPLLVRVLATTALFATVGSFGVGVWTGSSLAAAAGEALIYATVRLGRSTAGITLGHAASQLYRRRFSRTKGMSEEGFKAKYLAGSTEDLTDPLQLEAFGQSYQAQLDKFRRDQRIDRIFQSLIGVEASFSTGFLQGAVMHVRAHGLPWGHEGGNTVDQTTAKPAVTPQPAATAAPETTTTTMPRHAAPPPEQHKGAADSNTGEEKDDVAGDEKGKGAGAEDRKGATGDEKGRTGKPGAKLADTPDTAPTTKIPHRYASQEAYMHDASVRKGEGVSNVVKRFLMQERGLTEDMLKTDPEAARTLQKDLLEILKENKIVRPDGSETRIFAAGNPRISMDANHKITFSEGTKTYSWPHESAAGHEPTVGKSTGAVESGTTEPATGTKFGNRFFEGSFKNQQDYFEHPKSPRASSVFDSTRSNSLETAKAGISPTINGEAIGISASDVRLHGKDIAMVSESLPSKLILGNDVDVISQFKASEFVHRFAGYTPEGLRLSQSIQSLHLSDNYLNTHSIAQLVAEHGDRLRFAYEHDSWFCTKEGLSFAKKLGLDAKTEQSQLGAVKVSEFIKRVPTDKELWPTIIKRHEPFAVSSSINLHIDKTYLDLGEKILSAEKKLEGLGFKIRGDVTIGELFANPTAARAVMGK